MHAVHVLGLSCWCRCRRASAGAPAHCASMVPVVALLSLQAVQLMSVALKGNQLQPTAQAGPHSGVNTCEQAPQGLP